MEAILFCGIQGSGKSTFYKQQFFNTHLRLSLDLLQTRNKEFQFLLTCFAAGQRFVLDNTAPKAADRKKYIELARAYGFSISGYYFDTNVQEAISRNNLRSGKAIVPEKGIWATHKKLEMPSYSEGYDKLYRVSLTEAGFVVEDIPK